MTTRIWLDSQGHVFEAPADARTCRDYEGKPRTHGLWKPDDPHVLVPQTLCGQRAGTIPGDGDVDCPDCRAIEEASASTIGRAADGRPTGTEAQPVWDES